MQFKMTLPKWIEEVERIEGLAWKTLTVVLNEGKEKRGGSRDN
jgi:hypothetical protein